MTDKMPDEIWAKNPTRKDGGMYWSRPGSGLVRYVRADLPQGDKTGALSPAMERNLKVLGVLINDFKNGAEIEPYGVEFLRDQCSFWVKELTDIQASLQDNKQGWMPIEGLEKAIANISDIDPKGDYCELNWKDIQDVMKILQAARQFQALQEKNDV